jgi:hypothetical protein
MSDESKRGLTYQLPPPTSPAPAPTVVVVSASAQAKHQMRSIPAVPSAAIPLAQTRHTSHTVPMHAPRVTHTRPVAL